MLLLQRVCKSPDCVAMYIRSCKSTLRCGHECGGIADETCHLPCLHEDCAGSNEGGELTATGEDLCGICYSSGVMPEMWLVS